MQLRFLFLISLGIIIFSCDGDEVDPLSYPSIYHKTDINRLNAHVQVFTSAGKISNTSVINKYDQEDGPSYDYLIGYLRNTIGTMDTIEFVDPQHARLNHGYYYTECSLTTQSDLFILTVNEVTRECCFYAEAYTHSLPYFLSTVNPQIQYEFIESSVRGTYFFGYQGRRKFVVTKFRGSLVAPLIHYTLHSDNGYASGYINSPLQKNFYKNIAPGDTVSIVESMMIFGK